MTSSSITLKRGKVPAVLSRAQEEVLRTVDTFTSSLVIGPPGTGKSFTIAVLALDYLSKGKSVLIASKTDQAVDVLHRKIERDLQVKGVALRAGRSNYKRELKNQLQDLLSNTRKRPTSKLRDIHTLEKSLDANLQRIKKLRKEFEEQVKNELKWGEFMADRWAKPSLFSKLKIRYISWRNGMQTPHWKLAIDFLKENEEQVKNAREYIFQVYQQRVHNALYTNRATFRDFLKSLTARSS